MIDALVKHIVTIILGKQVVELKNELLIITAIKTHIFLDMHVKSGTNAYGTKIFKSLEIIIALFSKGKLAKPYS